MSPTNYYVSLHYCNENIQICMERFSLHKITHYVWVNVYNEIDLEICGLTTWNLTFFREYKNHAFHFKHKLEIKVFLSPLFMKEGRHFLRIHKSCLSWKVGKTEIVVSSIKYVNGSFEMWDIWFNQHVFLLFLCHSVKGANIIPGLLFSSLKYRWYTAFRFYMFIVNWY